MKVWPWNRFEVYETDLEHVYAKLEKSELAEVEAQLAAVELTSQLEANELARKKLYDYSVDLGAKLLQANQDYEAMRQRYLRLEAELNNKACSAVVLQPPTKHVPRKQEEPTRDHPLPGYDDSEELGGYDGLEGLVHTGWPFPTAHFGE